jgi:iron complex outermembrane receptor protein
MRHDADRYPGRILTVAALVASVLASPVMAQSVLDEVVVSANRQEQQAFDAPAAINSVGVETLSVAGPQVNVSEALSRIPGISASNRNNYAQDPQISIRGFGARAAFGVRGIKLVTDGIPASIPDGQGQASTFALTSTDRIEVLRGPLAVLYGNSSGGVIQAFTRKASETPELSLMGYTGSYGLRREDVQFSTTSGKAGLLGDYSRFTTDGYRDNSRAKRTQFNGKYDLKQSAKTQLSFILNLWDQPYAWDPAGLTAAQMASDRTQAGTDTESRRVRKITSQEQLGATFRHEDSVGRSWEGRVYGGQRENLQYQTGIPGISPNGAWVGLDREYRGLGLTASGRLSFAGLPVALTGGVDVDYSKERRQGGNAKAGEKDGAPTRNEDNVADSFNTFVVGTFYPSETYTVTAGARLSEITLESKDFYLNDNRDGSGVKKYSQFSPVVGVTRHLGPSANIFVNYGQGFESPTLVETAYSREGSVNVGSFRRDLKAAKNEQAELGFKWRPSTTQSFSGTLFWVQTTDEIVTDLNRGGQTSFKNAPKTRRLGSEISWQGSFSKHWRSVVAFTYIDAQYTQAFDTQRFQNPSVVTDRVNSGNKLPAIPSHSLFADLEWAQARNSRAIPQGLSAGVELQSVGRRYANDLNTLSAESFETIAFRAGYSKSVGITDLQLFARIDNALDEKYVGSVIVNAANDRVFEPSPERNWMVGVKTVTRF